MDLTNTLHHQNQSDPHSFSKPKEAKITHVDWVLKIDFSLKKISGAGTYFVQHKNAPEVVLDVKGILIQKVTLDDNPEGIEFKLSEENPILGNGLHIPLKQGTEKVVIHFETQPDAAALQWLEPSQTAGKVFPFLFTQSQAILARTWLPCQDSPSVRFTYTAQVTIPPHLLPLMSADNPQCKNETGIYYFMMEQPIPSYLLSLAVGDLEFAPVGGRCGVYAEPVSLENAAWEFAETEKMLKTAEQLYGHYLWGRYDLLVLPPSFPFGGMENPKLTFATPTIIAGDRSLTSLVAHELAHSWSGNLVTNATWNDFWLNEGFTVYFERRIMEHLYGQEYAEMLHTLGYQDLLQTLKELPEHDTSLKLDLSGRDPDEGLTEIAYEKGNYFLRHLERLVGREKFDQFVTTYFSTFSFQSMDTECFIEFLEKELINGNEELRQQVNLNAWIYSPGLPATIPAPQAVLFEKVEQELQRWREGTKPVELETSNWSSHEWQYFLRSLPSEITESKLSELDQAYNFTQSGNSEVLAEWLLIAVHHQYQSAYEALENFLTHVGRRKFLMPLYKALLHTQEGTALAKKIYSKARPNYHAVAYTSIDQLLEAK
ncbi:M1 family metallopeptidase [Rufibacter roseus]|uniref:Aminopeptidase N n=1 Tax=Rufibacter roseus TaxID=1567108 RepID=A0ABW2DSX0_9BACT|nr:M1 family metallopeptidase [Rufibacter roseus]